MIFVVFRALGMIPVFSNWSTGWVSRPSVVANRDPNVEEDRLWTTGPREGTRSDAWCAPYSLSGDLARYKDYPHMADDRQREVGNWLLKRASARFSRQTWRTTKPWRS
jgi:hypothetical protein